MNAQGKMTMNKRLRLSLLVLSLTLIAVLSSTQAAPQQQADDAATCSQLVELALQEVGNNCSAMDRNSTCYGYDQVRASFISDVPDDFFSKPADRASLTELKTIETAPFDPELKQWGVALMNVQANVPNTLPGQAVTFILLGDPKVENAVDPTGAAVTPVTVDISVNANARLRSGANINTNLITTVAAGTVLKADGISPDGQWVRVGYEASIGWVYRDLVTDMSVTAGLSVVADSAKTPMQAFYFTTGIGDVQCADAPDMLLVQGPKGVKVDLNINGADIQVGSTIALTNASASYTDFANDPELSQTYSTTLTGKNLPADTNCEKTTMTMLEGLALLNDNVSALPIGYRIESIACRDAQGNNVLTTPWRGLERVPEQELQQFKVVERLPENVLTYKVSVPSQEQINAEERRVLAGNPTEAPTTEMTATPEPTTETGGGGDPQPTTPPEETQEAVPQS